MSTDSIFNSEGTPPANGTAAGAEATNSNPLATLLAGIKNESGSQKYASVEEALKGASHAQEYIAQLKREKEEAERQAAEAKRIAEESKGQLTEQETLKRTIEELTQKFSQSTTSANTAMTPEQIAEMVNRTLEQNAVKQTAAQNTQEVIRALKEKFGEKAEEQYLAAAADMGLSVADMNALAAKSPKAVLKALGVSGVQAKPNHFAPNQSALNTAGFQPKTDTMIKRNTNISPVGATTADVLKEAQNSKAMVDEVHAAGYTMYDLSDPKIYRKIFNS